MLMNKSDKTKKNLHAGHRQRLISRFEKEGLLHFEPHNILELLLFYCIPRRDTNEIAHQLLNTFGSLHSVLAAPEEDLKKVDGIGPSSARFLKLVFETGQRAQLERLTENPLITVHQLRQIGVEWFAGKAPESIMAMLLDQNIRFLEFVPLDEEKASSPELLLDAIRIRAQAVSASRLVLYHNHPQQDLTPSAEDILTTQTMHEILLRENLILLDHLIVAGEQAFSILDSCPGLRTLLSANPQ